MNKRLFINWPVILLGMIAVTGFCFTPVLADETDFSSGITLQQEEVIAPIEDLENDFDPDEESFGTNYQYTWVSAFNFQRYYDSGVYEFANYYGYLTVGNLVAASIRLPSGAYLSQARLYYYDNSANNIRFGVFRHELYSNLTTLCTASPTGTPGYATSNCNPGVTIANRDNLYHIYVTFVGAGGSDLKFAGVRLYWWRQINPNAISYQRFTDVAPSHWAYREIQALAAAGITTSCGGDTTRFCPDRNVTKAAMATFLARALGLHWPAGSGY